MICKMLGQKGNSIKIRQTQISAITKDNNRDFCNLIVNFVSATQNALEGIISRACCREVKIPMSKTAPKSDKFTK